MKIIVISYSLTGNNEALAISIAAKLAADHIRITESRSRTTGTIIIDMLFNRIPQVSPIADKIEDNDLIVFMGPVWLGQVATPLRAHMKCLKTNPCKYAFVSISGGADGPNPKLASELTKRTGREPAAVIDLHIAELLPPLPKPTRKVTSAYQLNDEDIKKLTNTVVKALQETMQIRQDIKVR